MQFRNLYYELLFLQIEYGFQKFLRSDKDEKSKISDTLFSYSSIRFFGAGVIGELSGLRNYAQLEAKESDLLYLISKRWGESIFYPVQIFLSTKGVDCMFCLIRKVRKFLKQIEISTQSTISYSQTLLSRKILRPDLFAVSKISDPYWSRQSLIHI